MVIEIEESEIEKKLVVVCRMCNKNFTPDAYACPYLYHPELGVHIPMCDLCRELLRKERES